MNDNKIGVFLSNLKSVELVQKILLKLGFQTVIIKSVDEGIDIFTNSKPKFLMIDYDFSNNVTFNLLDSLQKDDLLKDSYLICTSFNSSEDIVRGLMEYNLIAFIPKPVNEDRMFEKFKYIAKKFKLSFTEKRKHVRIYPPADDLVQVRFVLKNKKRISGKILDMSVGGLAIHLYTNYEDQEIKTGKLIEHVIFNVPIKEADVDAVIIKRAKNFMALKFTHFYGKSYELISKYIIKNLSR